MHLLLLSVLNSFCAFTVVKPSIFLFVFNSVYFTTKAKQNETSQKSGTGLRSLCNVVRFLKILVGTLRGKKASPWTFSFHSVTWRSKHWGEKNRVYLASLLDWVMSLQRIRHKKAVRHLTCRNNPICSSSSLRCSIFLLMVKLGSVELMSWRFPLVKAGFLKTESCVEFQRKHSKMFKLNKRS